MSVIQFVLHWLAIHLGIDNESGQYYAWWSGAGSDAGELTLLTGAGAVYWHHQCHVDGCHRLGRHPIGNTGVKVCRRCHPDLPKRITLGHVHALHHAAKKGADRP